MYLIILVFTWISLFFGLSCLGFCFLPEIEHVPRNYALERLLATMKTLKSVPYIEWPDIVCSPNFYQILFNRINNELIDNIALSSHFLGMNVFKNKNIGEDKVFLVPKVKNFFDTTLHFETKQTEEEIKFNYGIRALGRF